MAPTNQNQPELTLDESLNQVMQTLPPIIRNYLTKGTYTEVAKKMMAKYGLRIDQGGVLEREIMLLLMGIENPDEFVQALTEEAKLDQKTISSMMQDVNTLVFVPLREEERKGGGTSAEQKTVPAISAATRETPTSAAPSGSHFHLQNKIPPPPRPVQSSTPMTPRPPSPAAVATPTPNAIPGNKLLEDHEEPHIEFAKAPVVSAPPAVARTAPPPANLPGAMPSGVIPPGGRPSFIVPPKMQPPVPTTPPAIQKEISASVPEESISPRPPERTPEPPTPPTAPISVAPKASPAPLRSYTVDPYREPIE